MDRSRQASSASRKLGKLQPVPEKLPSANPKFKGSMMVAELPDKKHGMSIDPNLLVGPLYVPKTSDSTRIKEQLCDITEKLHETLYTFDEFEDFEHEDPVVAMVRKQIGQVDDKNIRSNLATFMNKYEDMSSQVSAANRDRDDMLMQLADWFTTDHVDLDDIKSAVDESEEEFMKQSYFSTMTNFEKLKKLQSQILSNDKQGISSKQLQQKKFELEKDVVDKFRVMKDMSIQTMKTKVSDDEPWKHAANEIVELLKNVRGENAEELGNISKKMNTMVHTLEKQATTIKSLTAELRDKKEVVKRLTDENGDLFQDVMLLRNRYTKYEKDLQTAQALISKLNAQKRVEGGNQLEIPTETGKSLVESVSKVLIQISEPKTSAKELCSDPTLLRSQLREYTEALDTLRSEFSRAADDIDELKVELQEKRAYIANIEEENEKLLKDVKKLKQERRKSIAAGFIPPAAGDGHKCDHCKCHVTDNEFEEEIESLKKEVEKWQEKCNYFKKCLADTERKLSDAFREISDLRMDRDTAPTPTVQTPTVQKTQEQPAQDLKKSEAPAEDTGTPTPQKLAKPAVTRPKPKKDVKPRYLDTPRTESQPQPLPPVQTDDITEHVSNLTQKQTRELKLYKAGDIQGKLNMLTVEIMEFVSEIGRLLYQDNDDESNKVQTKSFDFESKAPTKKTKEVKDSKDEEANQKKSMVFFCGQQACAKLREAFDTLSVSLKIQHNEHEAIYRSFKISQQRNHIRRMIIMRRLPVSALQEFDREQRKKMREQESMGADSLLHAYFNISYGGGSVPGVKHHQGGHQLHHGDSSMTSVFSDTADESEAKLKNTMHMLRVQRSRSDLDVRDTPNSLYNAGVFGGGMMKERSQVYMPTSQEHLRGEALAGGHKQEMKVGMAVINKKGLIALTTNDVSDQLPELSATGEARRVSHDHGSGKQRSKSLIKRKDLMDHYKAGFKILEDEEMQKHQEEELTKSLGDYTIVDLQSKILEMTDAKSPRRSPYRDVLTSPPSQRKVPLQMKSERTVTLPAIKNFNPF